MIVGKVWKRLKKIMMGYVGQFFLIKAIDEPKVLEKSSKIKKLLEDFSYVFKEPKSLSLVKGLVTKLL